jgi:hypothetical protein
MTKIVKGTVKEQVDDQIIFSIEKEYLDPTKKIVKSSSGKIILKLPKDYIIEEVKVKNDAGADVDGYKVTLNKDDDYQEGKFAVMLYPVTFGAGGSGTPPPVQDTQYHPKPKFLISYAGEKEIWGKVFNLKDL